MTSSPLTRLIALVLLAAMTASPDPAAANSPEGSLDESTPAKDNEPGDDNSTEESDDDDDDDTDDLDTSVLNNQPQRNNDERFVATTRRLQDKRQARLFSATDALGDRQAAFAEQEAAELQQAIQESLTEPTTRRNLATGASSSSSDAAPAAAGASPTPERQKLRRIRAATNFNELMGEPSALAQPPLPAEAPNPVRTLTDRAGDLRQTADTWREAAKAGNKLGLVRGLTSKTAKMRRALVASVTDLPDFELGEGHMARNFASEALDLQSRSAQGLDTLKEFAKLDSQAAIAGSDAFEDQFPSVSDVYGRLQTVAQNAQQLKSELSNKLAEGRFKRGEENALKTEYDLIHQIEQHAATLLADAIDTQAKQLDAYPTPLAGNRDFALNASLKELGSGAFGKTYLVNFDLETDKLDTTGSNKESVWKPITEGPAATSYEALNKLYEVSDESYWDRDRQSGDRDIHLEQRAVASWKLSETLQGEDAMVVETRYATGPRSEADRTSVFGVVMERGGEGPDYRPAVYTNPAGQEVRDISDAQLDSPGVRRQLSTAQFLDSLSGQVDRHLGNFTFKPGKNGEPELQLFDNDQAFGTKNDVYNILGDMSDLNDDSTIPTESLMPLPKAIDANLARRINGMQAGDIDRIFGEHLSEDSRESLKQRLQQIKDYIKTIPKLAADDPQWNAPSNGAEDAVFRDDAVNPVDGVIKHRSYYHALKGTPHSQG